MTTKRGSARKPKLREDQVQRYSRHIILPEVGGEGQKKLLKSRVAVIGAGGIGSPVLQYLAAAGVGTLDIIDSDRVDLTNLQRQIIHNVEHLGVEKVKSAREAIELLNPDVHVNAHDVRISSENALELLRDVDVVIDGSDNFTTRYLVNDACFFLKKPLVSGSVLRFEAQMTVFPQLEQTPCYRCLFPNPPMKGLVPTCSEAGILGSVTGLVGSILVTETIKLLLGMGETLTGRLVTFEALPLRFQEIKLRWNADCPLCGMEPRILELQELSADDRKPRPIRRRKG